MNIVFRLIPLVFRLAGWALLAGGVLLAGCAAGGARDPSGQPKLERITTSSDIAPKAERLTLEDLVAMERAGRTPREIVGRVRAAGQRFDMDVPQQKQLRSAGASPALIDALVTAEAEARRTDRLSKEADDATARRDERRYVVYRDYYYPAYYPYVGYGSYGGWYGGVGWYW